MIIYSIILPSFNEAQNIPLILKRFKDCINGSGYKGTIEIIIVDNGSNDESPKILKKLIPKYDFAKSIRINKNIGYGFGIYSGLKEAKGTFIGWTHADMQTDPADVINSLNKIKAAPIKNNIYVKGNRVGRPIKDSIFSFGMSIFEFLLLGIWLPEINAQPNIFHKSLFEKLPNPPNDFSFDLFYYSLAKKYKYSFLTIEVNFPERIYGKSKWNLGLIQKVRFIKRTIKFSLKLKYLISKKNLNKII